MKCCIYHTAAEGNCPELALLVHIIVGIILHRGDRRQIGPQHLREDLAHGVDAGFALDVKGLALIVDAVEDVLHILVFFVGIIAGPFSDLHHMDGIAVAMVGLEEDQRIRIVLLNGVHQL